MIKIERDKEASSASNLISETWSVEIPANSILSICGSSGSGKSEFCLLLAGLGENADAADGISLDGTPLIKLSARERADRIAFVPSDPSLMFSGIRTTLGGEMDLAWRMIGQPLKIQSNFLADVINAFRLQALLARDPFTLSGGEAARAALAIALLKKPQLLILDQMMEQLDTYSKSECRSAINSLLPYESVIIETASRASDLSVSAGLTEISFHCLGFPKLHGSAWKSAVSQRGRSDILTTAEPENQIFEFDRTIPTTAQLESPSDPLLRLEGLRFQYPNSGFKIGPLDIFAESGERIAIVGKNGVGKTTLLKCLALLEKPQFERLEVKGSDGRAVVVPDDKHLHEWAQTALYCFQRPEDQLYLGTVREELIDTARRFKIQGGEERALKLAGDFRLTEMLDRSPFDLSRGHRRLLPIISALAIAPPLLLLDEPTVGLDDDQVLILTSLLSTIVPKSLVFLVSHDANFLDRVSNRFIAITSHSNSTEIL
jgi:energy-coupling factor transport system ATP-binding protein